ncbi:MAG TPA: dihydrodipicolinate synthase family protein [Thermomicrobiales bacterium]|nr:dihydrodipicolinate synthase family protein [Thermomicrobiales bacterium]
MIQGVNHVLATPFTAGGALDFGSLRRLTEAMIGMGIDGVTVLGVAGETQKLTDDERRQVIETVIDVNAGRVPIFAGTTRDGTEATIAASLQAQQAGAAGVMIAPPLFVQAGPGLTAHFQKIGDALDIPIILQDYPPLNGVSLSPRALADLAADVPRLTTIKLEDAPTPQRIAQTLALVDGQATIVGGIGGMYLLDELRAGSSGTMTGFAYTETLVEVWRAWHAGDRRAAEQAFYRHLPLLIYEGQPKVGLAIRKEILRRRGFIDCALVRRPGPSLDETTLAGLDATMAFVGIEARSA